MGVRQVKSAQTLLRFMAHAHWAFPSPPADDAAACDSRSDNTEVGMNFDATGGAVIKDDEAPTPRVDRHASPCGAVRKSLWSMHST